jgi:hypothetical protein
VRKITLGSARRVHALRAVTALALLLGYADLERGGLTVAPLLLVTSYLLLVPLSLLSD